MTTGKLLKKMRKSSGLSQGQLATLINTTPQYVSNIENGRSSIPARLVLELSRVLSCNLTLLVNAKVSDYKQNLLSEIRK